VKNCVIFLGWVPADVKLFKIKTWSDARFQKDFVSKDVFDSHISACCKLEGYFPSDLPAFPSFSVWPLNFQNELIEAFNHIVVRLLK